jgi:hypothetical protein
MEPYWSTSCRYRDGVGLIDAALAAAPTAGERARGRAHLVRSMLLRHFSMDESLEDADAALELSATAGDLEARCMALDVIAAITAYLGDHGRAQGLAREERALAERLGDPYHVSVAVMRQSWTADSFGEARAFMDEARPLLRRCGNLRYLVEMSLGFAGAALHEGEYELAAEVAEEGLRAAEEAGESFGLAFAVGNVGLVALFREDMDVAEQRFREQLEIQQRERFLNFSDEPVAGLACIAAGAGDPERAATLIGGHDAMTLDPPLAEGDLRGRDLLKERFIAPARAALGEGAWKRAAAAGAAMTVEDLCEFALDRPRAAAASAVRTRDP